MKYDAKAHNGRIKNATQADLDARNDRKMFAALAKLADTTPELALVLICFLYFFIVVFIIF